MTRNVDAAMISAMGAGTFEPMILIEMLFDAGTLRLWNGLGEVTVDSVIFTGAGGLISISEAAETAEIVSKGLSVSLSGIPSEIVALALTEPFQGRKCTVWLGFKGSDTTVVLYRGLMDQMNMESGDGTATVTLLVENEMAKLDRVKQRLYTDKSHQSRWPGDKAFSFVPSLGKRPIAWGSGVDS